MTIVDSLKAKGSTGGNNIAEAIKNLPMGGGNEFVINHTYDQSVGHGFIDKTFDEIFTAIKQGLNPVIIWTDTKPTDPNYLYHKRFIYSSIFMGGNISSVRRISFVNTNMGVDINGANSELLAVGDVYAVIVMSDDTLHYVGAEYREVYLDD